MKFNERMLRVVVLVVFAVVFISLTVTSYMQKSATWDEPQHLIAGYNALRFHDYRTDPEHPPFLRMWAALPLLVTSDVHMDVAVIDRIDPVSWINSGQFMYCPGFLFRANDADRLLYRARFMITLLGVLLGILIFTWAREWLGFWPATVALAGYCLEPNLLAHAGLVTTDFGVACFIFGSLYFAWRTARCLNWPNLTGLTVFFALAVVSKFSAVLLGPIVLMLLAVRACRNTPWRCRIVGDVDILSRARRALVAVGLMALLTAAAWASVWAVYGFRYSPSASPDWSFRLSQEPAAIARTPLLTRLVAWVDARRLLPNAFSQGFLVGQARAKVRPTFLAGRHSLTGWWYYFPAAFLIKTPIAFIILVGAGLVARVRHRRTALENELFIVLPIAVYFAAAITQHLNIGLRHILPIYPLALLLMAAGVAEFLRTRRKAALVMLGFLGAFWVWEFARVCPDYLTFFNQFVGGPRNGYRYLVDSNLDWGQDLKPLKQWLNKRGVGSINLAYFGTADPAYYDIQYTRLPSGPLFAESLSQAPQLPGYVAVSATLLMGVYLDNTAQAFYRPFLQHEPAARIGNSIHVYWVEKPWWR